MSGSKAVLVTHFVPRDTNSGGEITRFLMLEDSFAVSRAARREAPTTPTAKRMT